MRMKNYLRTLSKDICMRCRKEFFSAAGIIYDPGDDKSWEKGNVYCTYESIENEEMPPSGCPYRLEHLMEMQRGPAQ